MRVQIARNAAWAVVLEALALFAATGVVLVPAGREEGVESGGGGPKWRTAAALACGPSDGGGAAPAWCGAALRAADMGRRGKGLSQQAAFYVAHALPLEAAALASAPNDAGLAALLLTAHAATLAFLYTLVCHAAPRRCGPAPLAHWCPVAARLLPVALATAVAALGAVPAALTERPAGGSALLLAARQWWWAALWGVLALLHEVRAACAVPGAGF
jgi:hypothetical protein